MGGWESSGRILKPSDDDTRGKSEGAQSSRGATVNGPNSHSQKWLCHLLRGGADVPAARLDGGAAIAAQRAFVGFVAGDGQIQKGAGFHREFDFAPATVNQRSGSHHAPARLLHHLNRLLRGAPGGPYVFNHQNVLVGPQRKSAAQAHDPGGIAFGKNGRNAAAAALWLRQGPRYFLADNDAAERGRYHRSDDGVREKRGQRAPQLFRIARILQDERALHVGAAVQAAGKLKMAVPDGAGSLEHAQQFFVLQHKSPRLREAAKLTAGACKRRAASSLAVA